MVSQLLTLYITPVFYIYMEQARGGLGRWRRRPAGKAAAMAAPEAVLRH